MAEAIEEVRVVRPQSRKGFRARIVSLPSVDEALFFTPFLPHSPSLWSLVNSIHYVQGTKEMPNNLGMQARTYRRSDPDSLADE